VFVRTSRRRIGPPALSSKPFRRGASCSSSSVVSARGRLASGPRLGWTDVGRKHHHRTSKRRKRCSASQAVTVDRKRSRAPSEANDGRHKIHGGEYRVTPLGRLGTYTVDFELAGFQTMRREGPPSPRSGFVAKVGRGIESSDRSTESVHGVWPVAGRLTSGTPPSARKCQLEVLQSIPTGPGTPLNRPAESWWLAVRGDS